MSNSGIMSGIEGGVAVADIGEGAAAALIGVVKGGDGGDGGDSGIAASGEGSKGGVDAATLHP